MTTEESPESPKKEVDISSFLSNAFAQVEDLPPRPAGFRGKYFNRHFNLLKSAYEQLRGIRGDLPRELLRPKGDMGLDNLEIYNSLSEAERVQIDEVREIKDKQLNDLIQDRIKPKLLTQTLPDGILEAPRHYHKQQKGRTCAVANFCSIFEEVTGQPVEETQMLAAARKQGLVEEGQIPGEQISEVKLIDVFRTQTFKEQFTDIRVSVVDLFMADFEDLSGLIGKIQAEAPQIKACAMIKVQSEVNKVGLHDVILISADEQQVIIHDPSNKVGSAFRQIPKAEFIERWGKTGLYGQLILFSR